MFLPLLGCFALLIGSFGFTIFTLLMLPALHAGPSPPTMPFADIPFLPLWWAILTSTTPFPILSGTSPLTSTLFRLPTSTGPWTLDSPLSTYQGSKRGFPLTCLRTPLSSTCPFPTPLWPPLSPRGTFLSPPLGRITCPFGTPLPLQPQRKKKPHQIFRRAPTSLVNIQTSTLHPLTLKTFHQQIAPYYLFSITITN